MKFYTSMSIVLVKVTKSLNMIYNDSVADQKKRKKKNGVGGSSETFVWQTVADNSKSLKFWCKLLFRIVLPPLKGIFLIRNSALY